MTKDYEKLIKELEYLHTLARGVKVEFLTYRDKLSPFIQKHLDVSLLYWGIFEDSLNFVKIPLAKKQKEQVRNLKNKSRRKK
jgi:hypothetical protein